MLKLHPTPKTRYASGRLNYPATSPTTQEVRQFSQFYSQTLRISLSIVNKIDQIEFKIIKDYKVVSNSPKYNLVISLDSNVYWFHFY